MSNCKNCSKPIEVKQGRRPREFCDNNQKCRNEYFRKNKKEATHKSIPIEQWKEIEKKLNQSNAATFPKEEVPDTPNENSDLITKYETEFAKLGEGQFAKARKKWLTNKINELKL